MVSPPIIFWFKTNFELNCFYSSCFFIYFILSFLLKKLFIKFNTEKFAFIFFLFISVILLGILLFKKITHNIYFYSIVFSLLLSVLDNLISLVDYFMMRLTPNKMNSTRFNLEFFNIFNSEFSWFFGCLSSTMIFILIGSEDFCFWFYGVGAVLFALSLILFCFFSSKIKFYVKNIM